MGTIVPAGSGEVEFRFHSNLFALGAAISLIALAVLGIGVAVRW
jgi:hypothetical protein